MKSYLFAHRFWEEIIRPGDTVIDATLGNGHDTLTLARLLQGQGRIIGYDIQEQAISSTQHLLEKNLSENERGIITLKKCSHETFEETEARLIVYNLGFLPGSDKVVSTHSHSTIKSLTSACDILQKEGAISVMCYVGHPEGEKEYAAVHSFFSQLSKEQFLVSHHLWINRYQAPSLFLCKRLKTKAS